MNALHRLWENCTDGIQTTPFWVGIAIGIMIGLSFWFAHECNTATEIKDYDDDSEP